MPNEHGHHSPKTLFHLPVEVYYYSKVLVHSLIRSSALRRDLCARLAILLIDVVCASWHTICDSNLHMNSGRSDINWLLHLGMKEVSMDPIMQSTQGYLPCMLTLALVLSIGLKLTLHRIKGVLSTSAIACQCLRVYLLTQGAVLGRCKADAGIRRLSYPGLLRQSLGSTWGQLIALPKR